MVHELEARREFACRLKPDRALENVDQAANFLADRGMLTRFPDCALPSLFGACHEEPARAGGRGFDLWPRTKWMFSFQLTQERGTILTKLHRGRSLYLSVEAAGSFDGLVRRSIEGAAGDDAALLDHLGRQGPSTADDLALELRWPRERLKRARNRLERVGAVISEGLVFEDASTWHFAPLRRWDQVVRASKRSEDPLADVLLAGVKAAVIAPESDVKSWFTWPVPDGIVDRLVEDGRLVRPAAGLIALMR